MINAEDLLKLWRDGNNWIIIILVISFVFLVIWALIIPLERKKFLHSEILRWRVKR